VRESEGERGGWGREGESEGARERAADARLLWIRLCAFVRAHALARVGACLCVNVWVRACACVRARAFACVRVTAWLCARARGSTRERERERERVRARACVCPNISYFLSRQVPLEGAPTRGREG
jgi:hypothetical protein